IDQVRQGQAERLSLRAQPGSKKLGLIRLAQQGGSGDPRFGGNRVQRGLAACLSVGRAFAVRLRELDGEGGVDLALPACEQIVEAHAAGKRDAGQEHHEADDPRQEQPRRGAGEGQARAEHVRYTAAAVASGYSTPDAWLESTRRQL